MGSYNYRSASPKSAGQTGRLKTEETVMLQFESKGNLEAEFFLLGGGQSFFYSGSSTDWIKAHPHYGE